MIANNISETDFGLMAPFDLSKIVSQYSEWSEDCFPSRVWSYNAHLIFTEKIKLISTSNLFYIKNVDDSIEPITRKFRRDSAYAKFLDSNFIFEKFSSSGMNQINLFDIIHGQSSINFSGHSSKINCLCKYDDQCFLSASNDKTIKIWDSRYNEHVQTFSEHLNAIDFITPLSSLMFATHDNTQIKIWDTRMSEKSISSIDFIFKKHPHASRIPMCKQSKNSILTLHVFYNNLPILQLYDINQQCCISTLNMPKNTAGNCNLLALPDSRVIIKSSAEIRLCNFYDCDTLDESLFQKNSIIISDSKNKSPSSGTITCHLHKNGFVLFDHNETKFYS